ncbi:MAG: RluA family pseudouridine synthase, partial [Saprospiraceae bacterium]
TSKRLKVTPFLRAAHRLDRPASGILVMAKTKTALTNLMAQFENRTVDKVYLATTERSPTLPSAELRHWLKKDDEGKKALITEQQVRNSQLATLTYRTLVRVGKGALLEIKPTTGRFHQIRSQLAHIGCPIVGDLAYGAHFWHLDQIKLHAHRLQLLHPKTNEPLVIESPQPSDW